MNSEGEWRADPSGKGDFRYFQHGRPTAWVSDGGRVYQLSVPAHLESVGASPSHQDPSQGGSALDLTDPTSAGRAVARPAGWYRNVADPNQLKYWNGSQWSDPMTSAAGPERQSDEQPQLEQRPVEDAGRGRRLNSTIAVTEAALVVIALVAVGIAVVRDGPGSASHADSRVASSRGVAPTTPSTMPTTTTTTLPTVTSPSSSFASTINVQVQQWWASAGKAHTVALVADIQGIQGLWQVADIEGRCRTFVADVASAAAVPPAPVASIEREWQITTSTSNRAATACSARQFTRMTEDLQPASLTIRDFTAQLRTYLDGANPLS